MLDHQRKLAEMLGSHPRFGWQPGMTGWASNEEVEDWPFTAFKVVDNVPLTSPHVRQGELTWTPVQGKLWPNINNPATYGWLREMLWQERPEAILQPPLDGYLNYWVVVDGVEHIGCGGTSPGEALAWALLEVWGSP